MIGCIWDTPGAILDVSTRSMATLTTKPHTIGFCGFGVSRRLVARLHAACSSLLDGRGSLVVKVTDSWPVCHEFEPRTAEDPLCSRVMHVKSVDTQTSSLRCSVEVRRIPELASPLLWCSMGASNVKNKRYIKGEQNAILKYNPNSRSQLPHRCLNEATPPPTSQANNTSNIVVSR
ncbi:hypothetical protein TNCV_3663541 [Trichonephila clavipes]|nr:hypothetical protein TNCV_3663541 [Trichonephila clavipes]